MTATYLDFPPTYCPIESAINPHLADAERRAIAWIDKYGFCHTRAEREWLIGSSCAEFYARFAPSADTDRIVAAICWIYWGFAFDDACCDEGPLSADPAKFVSLAGRLQRALETPGLPPDHLHDRFANALHNLGEQFRSIGTALQARRFYEAHRAWLFGALWQIGNRARNRMPDLDEYLTMLLHSAGGEPTYALLELANGPEVPAREMDSPAVRALTEMAIMVGALDNDRHSFRKEAGDQNIFNVLLHHHRSQAQAVQEATALRDRILIRFLSLREQLPPTASDALHLYLTDLGHGIRGNVEWGMRVTRYLSLNRADESPEKVAAPTRIEWADHPTDASTLPPPLPSISWWWDELAF